MSVIEYKTVHASINQLGDKVKAQLSDGWQPIGSILVDEYENAIQAMSKEDETSATTTDYTVIKSSIRQIDTFVNKAISEGWQPIGSISRFFNEGFQAMKKGESASSEDGAPGAKGAKGDTGADGVTPSLSVEANEFAGLAAAADLQELAEALSARIYLLENNIAPDQQPL